MCRWNCHLTVINFNFNFNFKNFISNLFIINLLLLFILFFCQMNLSGCHPAPGLASCHGPVLGVKYIYSMETEMVMNNNDMKEPTGFGLVGEFHGINVWQSQDEYLLKLQLDWVQFKSRKGAKFGDGNKIKDWNKPLYVRISQGGLVLGALVHQEDVITAVNLKKTLAQHLISKNGEKVS